MARRKGFWARAWDELSGGWREEGRRQTRAARPAPKPKAPKRSSFFGDAPPEPRGRREVDPTFRALRSNLRRERRQADLWPNPGDRDARDFAAARALAREINGPGHGTVVELEPDERPPGWGRFAALVGSVTSIVYETPRGSARAGVEWEHESGDRGLLGERSRERPKLIANPRTRRVAQVDGRSPLRVVKGWLSG